MVRINRFQEWFALWQYCRENREELERRGIMIALVYALQRHWAKVIETEPLRSMRRLAK